MKRVPEPHRPRKMLITSVVIICLLAMSTALIKVPETVSGSCLLDPVRHWDLTELQPGSFKAGTTDLLAGELRHYRVYQFDRPSFVDLSLVANTAESGRAHLVKTGDLLATANSTSLSIEMTEKQTELADTRAELEVLKSGSKPTVLQRAELAIKLARSELKAYELQYNRQKDLFQQEILSSEDWEAAEARLELLNLDVEIAQAKQLELASSASPEKIERALTSIASLEKEVAALQDMVDAMEIRTPIDGRLSLNQGTGPLLSVANTDTMIARILIPQRHAQKPQPGQSLKIVVPGLPGDAFTGEVLRVNQQITLTSAGPFITVIGLLVNTEGRLVAGMTGKTRISGETTTLLQQLKREITSTIRQEILSR